MWNVVQRVVVSRGVLGGNCHCKIIDLSEALYYCLSSNHVGIILILQTMSLFISINLLTLSNI